MEIFFSHQFCDFLTFEQTLSEYFYVPGSGEGTQKWTPLNGGRGSKLVENLWMIINTFFIGEELREKSIYLLLLSGKMTWLFEWNPRENQGKCFELFCLKPVYTEVPIQENRSSRNC